MYSVLGTRAIGVDAAFDEAVELAAHWGFEGIAIDTEAVKKAGPESIVQMLEERNLKPGAWALPVRLISDESAFAAELEELPETAELCARAGARRCELWIPPGSDEMRRQQMFAFVRDRLRAVCAVLEEHDVRLGLEFIGPLTSRAGRRHEFIHSLEGTLELWDALESDSAGLLLDCWHLYTSGASMEAVLQLSDAQVVDVHISDAPEGVPREQQVDNVRRLPGETGVIDVPRFMECLQQIGYSGPVMAEPLGKPRDAATDMEAIRATRAALESVWPD
jgi:sugar phosphate isomerase/epimerase